MQIVLYRQDTDDGKLKVKVQFIQLCRAKLEIKISSLPKIRPYFVQINQKMSTDERKKHSMLSELQEQKRVKNTTTKMET